VSGAVPHDTAHPLKSRQIELQAKAASDYGWQVSNVC